MKDEKQIVQRAQEVLKYLKVRADVFGMTEDELILLGSSSERDAYMFARFLVAMNERGENKGSHMSTMAHARKGDNSIHGHRRKDDP